MNCFVWFNKEFFFESTAKRSSYNRRTYFSNRSLFPSIRIGFRGTKQFDKSGFDQLIQLCKLLFPQRNFPALWKKRVPPKRLQLPLPMKLSNSLKLTVNSTISWAIANESLSCNRQTDLPPCGKVPHLPAAFRCAAYMTGAGSRCTAFRPTSTLSCWRSRRAEMGLGAVSKR